MASIRLLRGGFGHVSLIRAANDLVTHAHPEPHIIIWLHGSAGWMEVSGQRVDLGPEVAVGVDAFQPHSHSFPAGREPGQFLVVQFDPEWLDRHGSRAASGRLFASPALALDGGLRDLCVGVLDRRADPDGTETLDGYEVQRLAECLVDAFVPDCPRRSGAGVNGCADHRVRKAVQMMRADPAERLGMDAMARSVGLSRPHFFALFKRHTNLSPNVYRNTLRMQEAQRRLENSPESLMALASSLGFTTQGNFTRFFRDHAGVPPKVYRDAARLAA